MGGAEVVKRRPLFTAILILHERRSLRASFGGSEVVLRNAVCRLMVISRIAGPYVCGFHRSEEIWYHPLQKLIHQVHEEHEEKNWALWDLP
jgi:hypothetical protein